MTETDIVKFSCNGLSQRKSKENVGLEIVTTSALTMPAGSMILNWNFCPTSCDFALLIMGSHYNTDRISFAYEGRHF